MSILLCLMQPQSWIPYVRMGFRICLYKGSFLCRDSEEFLPISQYSFFVSYVQFLSFLFDMGFPAELSVQGHAKVFSHVSIWYLLIVKSKWDVFKASDC